MNNTMKVTALLVGTGAVLGWSISSTKAAFQPVPLPAGQSATYLPTDAYPSCTLSAGKFDTWFKSGKAKANGIVVPANSVTFPHKNNCDFYQWSEQMFLWATSSSAGLYGGNGIVLESPLFYDVMPEDTATYTRKMVPHVPGIPFKMSGYLVKNGAHRLPVVRSTAGKLFEVESTVDLREDKPKQKALVMSISGIPAQPAAIRKTAAGIIFYDKSDSIIQHPKAIIRHTTGREKIVQRFITNEGSFLLSGAGEVVDAEVGQATGDVLMSKDSSIVYYLTMVNDVYAYFLTGMHAGKIVDTTFPVSAADRDQVTAFARSQKRTLPDSNALALEIKSSWVEASTVKNPKDYITVMATIPVYNKLADTLWAPFPGKTKTVPMALIGMHIVGSVNGHPEMIWATFEHQNNSPNTSYSYVDNKKNVKNVQQDVGTGWLLAQNTTDSNYNIHRMRSNFIVPPDFDNGHGNFIAIDSSAYGDSIYAIHTAFDSTIGPSNTQRIMPWGAAYGLVTNPEDGSAEASNSEIISLNSTIRKLLAGNDVRKNYLLIGATWTNKGMPPNGYSYGQNHTDSGVAIGTSSLANSTMETYAQSPGTSCFGCHNSGTPVPNSTPGGISHIYTMLRPLDPFFKKQFSTR